MCSQPLRVNDGFSFNKICKYICLVPSGPPQNVTCTNITSSSITIEWEEPSPQHINDKQGITGYHLKVDGRTVGSTTTRSYTFSNLSPGVEYTLTILPVNSVGTSEDRHGAKFTCTTPSTSKCRLESVALHAQLLLNLTFTHHMLSVHTPHALSVHTTCSQCTHHMLSVHTPHALSAHTTCSQCTHHMLSVYTPHALSVHTTCSQCTHHMLSVHPPHALSAHTTCSQCTHHMLSVHPPHALSAHTTCSQCTHHMLSVYTPHALSAHTTCSQCTHHMLSCSTIVWCELPLLPDSVLKSHYPQLSKAFN